MRIGGIILCGGQSRRMGQPKEWLPFGDELLLQRVVRIVASVVSPIVVVAEPLRAVPALPANVRIVRDELEYQGPLQGLAGGLRALMSESDGVYLSACDVPLLRSAFVHQLVSRLNSTDIVLPEVDGFRNPLAAAYRSTVLITAERLLAQHHRRLLDLTAEHSTIVLTKDDFHTVDPELESLRNMNTPEEYQALLKQVSTV